MTTESVAAVTASAADPATDEAATAKKLKRRRQRRVAKALLHVSLIATAVMILAEPWLLIPIGITAVAISLWD